MMKTLCVDSTILLYQNKLKRLIPFSKHFEVPLYNV